MRKLMPLLGMVFHWGWVLTAFSEEAPRMTKEQLRNLLGQPDVIVIDVRYGKEWTQSDSKIKGAVREDPEDLKSWANKYSPHQTLVLY
ncbi:MAG: hypothetical protein N3G78_12540 [Desulfobacterota bacterium]|nr:hypothetical protein [Thermodesulfobacteriota bacterium]